MASTTLGPVLAPFERRPDALIPLLQAVQEHLGYLPPEALQMVARHARVPRLAGYGRWRRETTMRLRSAVQSR